MRFVIHYHESENSHYDFMLENNESLDTWQISEASIHKLIAFKEISAEKIFNHRKKYLEYEGPISCDRGRVEIFDSGEYCNMKESADSFTIDITGEKIKGSLYIKQKSKTKIYSFLLSPSK